MKILVPDTIDLDLSELQEAGHSVVTYDAGAPFPSEAQGAEIHDAEVLVVWQSSNENVSSAAGSLGSLRLVQTLAAGPDQVVTAGFQPDVTLASGRGLHDGPVAEHALALVLAGIRRLDVMERARSEHHWASEFVEVQQAPATLALYTLDGARVTIWGFGSIAARLAPLLAGLGATVTGVASTAGTRHGFEVVATDDLPALLATTDVLVSLVPLSDATRGAFDASLIAALKPGALFVNVGRGATVNEADLVAALTSGQLRCAALDVMATEPLPASSPLWDAPNIILTPHVAGARPHGAAALVTANVSRLAAGEPMLNLVER